MSGLSRHTGREIGFDAHLAQSIADILTTPVGSRVLRRDYGSDLPRLIDRPMNGATTIELFQATAEAIDRWEPRFTLRRVQLARAIPGAATLILIGDVLGGEQSVEVVIGEAA